MNLQYRQKSARPSETAEMHFKTLRAAGMREANPGDHGIHGVIPFLK